MPGFTPKPAFDVALDGDHLRINLHRDFDANSKDHDWVNLIITRYPGPYPLVALDVAAIGARVNSSLFSGLYRLNQHYNKGGTMPITLLGAHERCVQGLEILALKGLFNLG